MRHCRSEFVTGQHKEHIRCHFLEHLIDPAILKGSGNPQQIHNYSSYINVANNHYVELTEEFELAQIGGRFAIGGGGFLQMADGP